MSVDVDDTIVAIASGSGRGARGIVRLSGSGVLPVCRELFTNDFDHHVNRPGPFGVKVTLQLDAGCNLQGQLLVWPTERSYTRQPSAEFHTFGSPPLLELVLKKFCEAGCRMARPGEFTMRAFLGGRLDLTQAEAVLALIDADNQRNFDAALQQLAGGLAHPLQSAQEQLLGLLAEVEAGLDFVEEDIEFVSQNQVVATLEEVSGEVQQLLERIESRHVSGETLDVVLAGEPNVGKSTLFNALLNEAHAITADERGTTRDVLYKTVERNGRSIRLLDTAGLESGTGSSSASIAARAQSFAHEQIATADLLLWCSDKPHLFSRSDPGNAAPAKGRRPGATIRVLTRCDLIAQGSDDSSLADIGTVVTADLQSGVDELWHMIDSIIAKIEADRAGTVNSTLVRCRKHCIVAAERIEDALHHAMSGGADELLAAELRLALDDLGQMVGTIYTDDILDRIFSQFCIGK